MTETHDGVRLLVKLLAERRTGDFLRLRDEMFKEGPERKTFAKLLAHYQEYSELISMDEAVRRRMIRRVDTPDSYGYYHDQLVKRNLGEGLDALIMDLQINGDSENPEANLAKLTEFMQHAQAMRADSQRALIEMKDMGQAVLDYIIEARTAEGITGIPTPWPTLNRETRGFQNSDLYLVLARVKMGKTMAMLEMANAAHVAGHVPLVISMEMRELEIAKRQYAARAGVNMNMLHSGQLSEWALDRLQEDIARMSDLHPYYFIEGQFKKDIQDVSALVHSLRPSIVFIDGGYLLKMARSQGKARWEKVSDIAEELKDICSSNAVPLVASYQFTRQVKQTATDADLGDTQLSDALSQIASVGIGIFADPDSESISASRRRLVKTVGGRSGENADFPINWDWDRMDFSEIVEAE